MPSNLLTVTSFRIEIINYSMFKGGWLRCKYMDDCTIKEWLIQMVYPG